MFTTQSVIRLLLLHITFLGVGSTRAEELYDLDADPWGVINLVDSPEQADVLARLRLEFKYWRKATGDADVHPSKITRRTERRIP